MSDTRDITYRLQDFDNYGNTATERYNMRLEAYVEIKALRERVEWLERQIATRRALSHANDGERQ